MPHADILDQSDPLNKPLIGSVVLHAAVFGTFIFGESPSPARTMFGAIPTRAARQRLH